MSPKKNRKSQKAGKAEEPEFPFRTIRKSTFEELENENRLYSLSLTPLQRLAYLHELNLNAFGRSTLHIKEIEKKIYKKD